MTVPSSPPQSGTTPTSASKHLSARASQRLINLILRAATLGSRFLFVFFLARYVPPDTLGLYGLFTATVGYALFFLGLDFYTYTTRELLKSDRDSWGGMIKGQAALTGVLYLVFLPLSTLLFVAGILPAELAIWFYVLLALEHLNQELSRLLTAISEQVLAGIVLFLRQGSWAVAAVVLMALDPSTRNLHHLFGAWTLAGLAAAVLALWRLSTMNLGGWRQAIDWSWVRRGLVICLPLLMATLALRGLFTFDRYLLNIFSGLETVGAYVLFFGMASTLLSFLDAGVFAYGYPELISTYQARQPDRFRTALRRMLRHTLTYTVLFVIISLALLTPLLNWIGRPLYLTQSPIYHWLLLAMAIYSFGMVPHYGLYAQGKDRPIIFSHFAGLIAFVPVCWLATRWAPSVAIPIGLCVAFGVILIWKTLVLLRSTPREHLFPPSTV